MSDTGKTDPGFLMERISADQPSPAEQRIITYLFNIAEYDIAGLTSTMLAQKTDTSRSTVERLARRLGYSGVRDFKLAFLRQNRGTRLPPGSVSSDPSLAASDTLDDVAYKVLHNASARALKFAEMLTHADILKRLVEMISEASRIEVFGAGASGVVGADLQQRLRRLGIRINFDPDHHNQIASASLMRPGELAIAISYSGRTKSVVEAARIAREQGAQIASIVGLSSSPLEEASDLTACTPPAVSLFGEDAVMTRVLEMMFNEVLFHCLALKYPKMLENVKKVEALLDRERS